MACYHPLHGYLSEPDRAGKQKLLIIGKARVALRQWPQGVEIIQVPCGQCFGCRRDRQREWAMRCADEALCHDENCFITLTYDEDHIPYGGTLVKHHMQDFMKRLRKRYEGVRIRFFGCGEYGEKLSRPHYHICLFGFDFADRVFLKMSGGNPLFTSEILESVWTFGFSTVAALSFETAAYTAGYVLKKQSGGVVEDGYYVRVLDTGAVVELEPEFCLMSRRPGIGADFMENYSSDVYPHDYCVVRGYESKPPRYYDKLYDIEDPEEFARVKERRAQVRVQFEEDNTAARLRVREAVALSRFATYSKRSLEDG